MKISVSMHCVYSALSIIIRGTNCHSIVRNYARCIAGTLAPRCVFNLVTLLPEILRLCIVKLVFVVRRIPFWTASASA